MIEVNPEQTNIVDSNSKIKRKSKKMQLFYKNRDSFKIMEF
jgi:hypothetical protein